MGNGSQLSTEESLRITSVAATNVASGSSWLGSLLGAVPARSRLMPFAYSLADQVLAVGGVFLVNVVLARAQTKEEYGTFVLSYSVFTFLFGVYNAAILEPYTVFGSGRYRDCYSAYLRLMARSTVVIGILLTGALLLSYLLLLWVAPHRASTALLGLGLTVGVLLSGTFLRRAFYVQRQAFLAAKSSLMFCLAVACGLWLSMRVHVLNGFSVFLVLAVAWMVAGAAFGRTLAFGEPQQDFTELERGYWREHWKYTRWSLSTALVFQLTTQGYYWLLAGLLSVKEVAEFRAMYLIVTPVEQVFISISFIVLPALATQYAAQRREAFVSLWKRNALVVAGATGAFALAVRFLGKPIMHVLYAGKFDGLSSLLYPLALTPMLLGTGGTMINALNAAEKPKLVFYGFLCSAAATFLGGIPLVNHFGLRGAVYGMICSGVTYCGALAAGFLLNIYCHRHPKQTIRSAT